MDRPLQFYRSKRILAAVTTNRISGESTICSVGESEAESAQINDACTHESLELLAPQPSTSFAHDDILSKKRSCDADFALDSIGESELVTLSDLDDSVEDPDFLPTDKESNKESSDSDIDINFQDFLNNDKNNSPNNIMPSISSNDNIDNTENNNNITYIAKYPGPIYINNTQILDENQQHEEVATNFKTLKNKLKHPMKPISCDGKCKRQCNLFSKDDRQVIWEQYWDQDYRTRRSFLNKCVTISSVKRRKVQSDGTNNAYLKNESRYFSFPNTDGNLIPVCRNFFLDTLGYKTDGVITELSKAVKKGRLFALNPKEQRGGSRRSKIIDSKVIKEHILGYHPVTSHHRRYNAPLTKYLPRHLTLAYMYTDFKKKHPNFKCGKESYRKQLKDLKISFHMPKSDKCPECLAFEEEQAKNKDSIPIEIKEKYECHKTKAEAALQKYKLDGENDNNDLVKYFSMDMQKVVILPEMPAIKDAFFMSRLVTFNLTFAPIQRKSKDVATCVLWHEGKAGRDASNIVDAILTFLESYRDVHHFYIWADNCTAQNKNWTLYTALVMIVNNSANNIESLTINYLTKGHTHMSADAVHANIELKMKRQGNIYDFQDFKDIVMGSRAHIKVLELEKVHEWPKKKRLPRSNEPLKEFNLNSVVEVKFISGSRNLLYKTRFESQFSELDFLMKRFNISSLPTIIPNPRGVKTEKKEEIIKKLVHLMPESRRNFWYNLPVNNNSVDLVGSRQHTE